jgi:hypothetical protein
MKKALAGFVIVLALMSGLTAYAAAAGVAGSWKMVLDGEGGFWVKVVLVQDGTNITGTITVHGEDIPVKGRFADGVLTFSTPGDEADSIHGVVHGGLKSDGTMSGDMSSSGGKWTWTATRLN